MMQDNELLPTVTHKLEELQALSEVGKLIISSLNIDEVFQKIADTISLLLRPENWSLLLVDEETNELYFEIVVGGNAEKLKDMRLQMGEGVAGWVCLHQKAVTLEDAHRDPRFSAKADQATQFSTGSIMAVPLVFQGVSLGVLEIVAPAGAMAYDAEQLSILSLLADFAAIAIANARMYQKVQQLTITDDCTSLFNARHMFHMLEIEVMRSLRYHHPVSVIFFDLDYFKRINDNHGHLIGSALLAEVGQLFRRSLREVDIPVRYGGDEFVGILPETSRDGAMALAQRFLVLLRQHSFCQNFKLALQLTASIGIATFPDDAATPDRLIEAADIAMYYAKQHGRDQMVGFENGQMNLSSK